MSNAELNRCADLILRNEPKSQSDVFANFKRIGFDDLESLQSFEISRGRNMSDWLDMSENGELANKPIPFART